MELCCGGWMRGWSSFGREVVSPKRAVSKDEICWNPTRLDMPSWLTYADVPGNTARQSNAETPSYHPCYDKSLSAPGDHFGVIAAGFLPPPSGSDCARESRSLGNASNILKQVIHYPRHGASNCFTEVSRPSCILNLLFHNWLHP